MWQRVVLVALLLLGAVAWWWRGGLDRVTASTDGHEKAVALVAAYAKCRGAKNALHQMLDKHNDRSFGDFGFHYFPETGMLQ